MTHHPVEELLGAYALDAVDAGERAEVDAHLAECGRCRAEVDAHREVAGHLASSGAPAPEGVWSRIAGALEDTPPPALRLVLADAQGQAVRARPRGRRWRAIATSIGAAAAAVAIVALGVSSIRQADDVDRLEEAQDLAALANRAFADPEARLAELVTPGGDALVRAAVLPDGSGFLLADALPDLDGRIYQLWGASGSTVVSLGTIGGAPGVVAFPADATVTQLMITAEDEPVAAPTAAPLVAGFLG